MKKLSFFSHLFIESKIQFFYTKGYISTNQRATDDQQATKSTKTKAIDNMNELRVNILRCARLSAKNKSQQPASYCIYKFYDFKDHDTEIIQASNYPEFNDQKKFACQMDIDLDKYLRKSSLHIYIFDDNQAENDVDYIGLVRIPLLALAHDKDIKGTFEIHKKDGAQNGTLDLAISWKFNYRPPSESVPSKPSSVRGPKTPEPKSASRRDHSPSESIRSSLGSRTSIKSNRNDDQDEANVTLRESLDVPKGSTSPTGSNLGATHYNDTYFADEADQQRTISPNEWNSMHDEYQRKVKASVDSTEQIHEHQTNLSDFEVTPKSSWDMTETLSQPQIAAHKNNHKQANTNSNSRHQVAHQANSDNKVTIKITNFSLYESSEALRRSDIKQLFVSMSFLDYEPGDLESPFPLPKPTGANQVVNYNFEKVFDVDANQHADKRQKLAATLFDKRNESVIAFAVVSEPLDGDDNFDMTTTSNINEDSGECEDIAYAFADINEIFSEKRDYIDEKIVLVDANDANIPVGEMTVTIRIIDALMAIQNEIELNDTTDQ
jgi:hypothetical protein